MDEQRKTLLAITSSLARLQLRLLVLSQSQRISPSGHVTQAHAAQWTLRDLEPPSPWFDVATPKQALSGALQAVALVQIHLLAMIEAPGPIDGLRACRVVEHLCGNPAAWGSLVERLAHHLGVRLPATPRDLHNGASIHQLEVPRRQA